MTWWEILGPYLAVSLVATRSIAGAIAWHWAHGGGSLRSDDRPDSWQWSGASFLGLAAGCVWPLVLLLWKLPLPVVGAERDQRLREREERIRELERETGIR